MFNTRYFESILETLHEYFNNENNNEEVDELVQGGR